MHRPQTASKRARCALSMASVAAPTGSSAGFSPDSSESDRHSANSASGKPLCGSVTHRAAPREAKPAGAGYASDSQATTVTPASDRSRISATDMR